MKDWEREELTTYYKWAWKPILLLAALAALLFLCGCSSSPSPPSIAGPTPRGSTVYDGVTGQELGRVEDSAAVSWPGYMDRRQPQAQEVYLWPGDGLWVRAAVYQEGLGALERRREGLRVRVPATLLQTTRQALEGALRELAQVTGLSAELVSERENVRIEIDQARAQGNRGLTFNTKAGGGWIVSSVIYFSDERWCQRDPGDALLHELGHALGLYHSPRAGDVMNVVDTGQQWSVEERNALTMMYRRRVAGNRWPDTEP